MPTFATLPPPTDYNRSIFTHTIITILTQKNKQWDEERCLQALRTIGVQYTTVKGLTDSLRSAKRLRALNRDQMQKIVLHFQLEPDQKLLLYAALLAMWPQRQLIIFGVPPQEVWHIITNTVGDSIIEWLQNNDAFTRFKGRPENQSGQISPEDQVAMALAPAIHLYDEAVARGFAARFVPDLDVEMEWKQESLCYFAYCANRLDEMTHLKQETEWMWWRQTVQNEIDTLLEEGVALPTIPTWP